MAHFQFVTATVIVGTIVALSDSIGYRIVVDGVLNAETIAHNENAVIFSQLMTA